MLQWEEVVVNERQLYDLKNNRHIQISNETVPMIEPNHDAIRYINDFHEEMIIVIFSLFYKVEILRTFISYYFPDNWTNITYARLLSPGYSCYADQHNLIEDKINNLVEHDYKHFFVVADEKAQNALRFRFNPRLIQNGITFTYMLPRICNNGYSYFDAYSHRTPAEMLEHMHFVDTIQGMQNLIALESGKPSNACFFRHTYNSGILGKNRRYYLFDYYSTAENNNHWKEPLSNELAIEVKKNGDSDRLSRFFCKALVSYITASNICLNQCAFLIIPSHKEGRWNQKLSTVLLSVLQENGWRHNTIHSLKRIFTIPPQHLKKCEDRSASSLMHSYQVDYSDLNTFSYVILIDDITTSGSTFDAASLVIRNCGFTGVIKSFAIAGTRKSASQIIAEKLPFDETLRSTAKYGIIFDLDNTLIDTENVRHLRETGHWEQIDYDHINPFNSIVYSLKSLIHYGIDVAIVTSSVSSYCRRMLSRLHINLNNIVCVCYHDTTNTKPNADPYLLAESAMPHNNTRIICVGDEYNDMLTCYNANKIKKDMFIPLYAGWRTGLPMEIKTPGIDLLNNCIQCLDADEFADYLIEITNSI